MNMYCSGFVLFTAAINVEASAFAKAMLTMQCFTCRYPGGLKERSVKEEFARDPTSILYRAVYGMLPKNRLRDVRILLLRGHALYRLPCIPIK
jgi:ribosomal protein L13